MTLQPKKVRLPTAVTILTLFVLSLTAWNGLRLSQAITFWDTLVKYSTRGGPVYIAASGAFWLVVGLVMLWGIWRRQRWTRIMAFAAAAGYTAWFWCDWFFLQFPRPDWPFAAGVTAGLMVFFCILLIDHQVVEYFQRGIHEQRNETPDTP